MKKRLIITGFIIMVIITAIFGVRSFKNRDTSYKFVTDISPDQIAVAQVLYYEPNEMAMCTVDLDKSEYETIVGILKKMQPNGFRQNHNENVVSNGPYLYVRLIDDAAEIMFRQVFADSDLFHLSISAESIMTMRGQFQVNSLALSEFISQKTTITS